MAYTYEDFLKAANDAGMLNKFNVYDLETAKKSPEFGLSLLSLQKDADSGSSEAKVLANASMNELRKQYGNYTIGDDGRYSYIGTSASGVQELKAPIQNDGGVERIYGIVGDGGDSYVGTYTGKLQELNQQLQNYGQNTFEKQPELDKLLEATTNPDPFSYDVGLDPTYGAYRKTYLREGDRAYRDMLATFAAANGGQISTSAISAAQQAQNYYNAQLADKVPELEQIAYGRYLQELQNKQNALDILKGEREWDENQWLTGYNMLLQQFANLQALDQTEYARYLDAKTLADNAVNNALVKYQTLGYATADVAAILGIPEGTAHPNASTTNSGGGTTGSSGSSGTYSGNGNASMDDVMGLQQYLNSLGVGINLTADGKYGSLSKAAVKQVTGQELSAEEAVQLWKSGNLVSGDDNVGGGDVVNFDLNNLIAIAPAGMNQEKIQKALSGDATLSSQLANWLDEKVTSGQLEEYEQNGKIKFRWKV